MKTLFLIKHYTIKNQNFANEPSFRYFDTYSFAVRFVLYKIGLLLVLI